MGLTSEYLLRLKESSWLDSPLTLVVVLLLFFELELALVEYFNKFKLTFPAAFDLKDCFNSPNIESKVSLAQGITSRLLA